MHAKMVNGKKAESFLADIFIASDRSRGAFDALASLALQDCPQNALYVYHILRAYQFQERRKKIGLFYLLAI